jgi:predicted transporter
MLSPYHPMQLTLGLIVWIVWFILKYGALAFICEMAPPPVEQGPLTWINAALLLGSLAITGLLLYWANNCWRAARAGINQINPSTSLFIVRLGAGINLLGAIVTLSQGVIALLLPPCL